MGRVRILGWKVGFNKVVFNKKLRQFYGYNIAESKKIVDDILNNLEVCLDFESKEKAVKFFNDVEVNYIIEDY